MRLKNIFLIALGIFSIASCGHDPLDVDASKTALEINYVHLDSILMNTPQEELISVRKEMSTLIPELFDYQIGYVLNIGRVEDTTFVNAMMQYRNDPYIGELEKEVAATFKDLKVEKKEILEGFRYLKTHLPELKTPQTVVFQNSLFRSSAFSTENEIGIGLERYLGYKSPSVKKLPEDVYFDWMKKGFERTYMSRDAVLSWILTHVLPEAKGSLSERIVFYGKALYLTEAAFPNAPKNIIVRYTQEQLNWAEENEYSFWKYLVDQNMLFKIDERTATNMLSEAPFTAGLPEKGPDRLGQYLGWQIVRNYMKENKVSVEELIAIPYNEILQSYEPK